MISKRCYLPWNQFVADNVAFTLGTDRNGKASIGMVVHPNCTDVAVLTPACVTHWPRVTGDGNFGTMWGPTDISKAKFSLDLTDTCINGTQNAVFLSFTRMLEVIDDKLLDFVHGNQLKILGRKNLSREEVKVLQIRSVRPKYDKMSGALVGHAMLLSTTKFASDGMGGRHERKINICDKDGHVISGATVAPGDVVAATAYANQVYTGVGGDKYGIHWSFEDIAVICQRAKLEEKSFVPIFAEKQYDFGHDYASPEAWGKHSPSTVEAQFSD